MKIEEIKLGLLSSKIGERRKAIKIILKDNITDLAENLFDLYIVEKEKKKSWEIQCELIEAIGILNYKPALEIIKSICVENIEHDMITIKAGGCFVRLSRENLYDINPVKLAFEYAKYSLMYGVLDIVNEDKMIFSDEETEYLIELVENFQPKRDKGYLDVRMGLASACAGWKQSKSVVQFLNNCLESDCITLIKVARNSLKGKRSL